MADKSIIGIDMGGTNICLGRVENTNIDKFKSFYISANGTKEKILEEIINTIYCVFVERVSGIGIGVPSIVGANKGIVYNVQNIHSRDEVPLKDILEEHFRIPVYVNNDANCFTAGEKHFGKWKHFSNVVRITIETGLGAGIIINDKLYSGVNCGTGEFGSIPDKDQIVEYYCSGQFFENIMEALNIFEEFRYHFSNAIQTILFSVNPGAILIGGSVSKAYKYFKNSM